MLIAGARGRLLGLWALVLPRSMFRSHVGTLWCHKQAALGVPLLDTECAEETIAAIFTWLAETYPRLRLIVFPKLIRSGPTFARLLAHALGCGLEWRLLGQYQRAVLLANRAGTIPSKERRDKLARQRRQLEKRGRVTLRSARTCAEITRCRRALFGTRRERLERRTPHRPAFRRFSCHLRADDDAAPRARKAARAELKRAVEIKAGFYRDGLPHSHVLSAAKKTRRSAHGKGA